MANTAVEASSRVRAFIEAVNEEHVRMAEIEAFQSSPEYKARVLAREMERGKHECMRALINRCYQNALPLSPEFKSAMSPELAKKCTDEDLYYIQDSIKKGTCSERCKAMSEAIDRLIGNYYLEKSLNPEDYNEEDLVFKMDPEMQTHLNIVADDLGIDDISELISAKVKSTAMSEINRAREEKEKQKAVEKELAENLQIKSEAAIEKALELENLNETTVYTPSLFNAMMISKVEKTPEDYNGYTFHALESMAPDPTPEDEDVPSIYTQDRSSQMYQAFVEAVEEYTWFLMQDGWLNKKPMTPHAKELLAVDYATGRK